MVTPDSLQRRILEHVGRYRLTTPDALHRLFYDNRSRDAALKMATGLVKTGWLQGFDVGCHRRKVYQLTRRGAVTAGYPLSVADLVREQSLFEHYAVLAFCCLRPRLRARLTPPEFAKAFPEFADAKGISAAHQPYYIDTEEGPPRLARILIDNGGETARYVRKCRETVRAANQTPALQQLVSRDLFMVSILTLEQSKAQAIADVLARQELGPLFRIHVIGELYHVL